MYPSRVAHTVPDIATADAIIAVAEEGSMARAARRLGITQQQVSARVAAAEKRWGVSLFDRSPQGSVPTAKGRQIIVILTEYQHATDRCRERLGAVLNAPTTLRVAASHTIAQYAVAGWVAALSATVPGVRCTVAQLNSAQALAAVVAGTVDVAFTEGGEIPARLHSVAIGTEELAVVAPADHPWSHRRRATLTQLERTPLVMRERGSGTRAVVEKAAATAGISLTPAAEFPSLSMQRASMIALGAPGVLPVRAIGEGLVPITVPGLVLTRTWTASYLTLTPQVAALLKLVQAERKAP